MNSNTIAVETCQEGGEYKMCPLCEDCDYWDLKDICLYKRLAYLFDHPGTVFYAIFMSFWDKIHYANDFAHYIMRYKIQCQKIQTAKNRLKILEICKNVQS